MDTLLNCYLIIKNEYDEKYKQFMIIKHKLSTYSNHIDYIDFNSYFNKIINGLITFDLNNYEESLENMIIMYDKQISILCALIFIYKHKYYEFYKNPDRSDIPYGSINILIKVFNETMMSELTKSINVNETIYGINGSYTFVYESIKVLVHESIKNSVGSDIERNCLNGSIKWEKNNCAVDTILMAGLFPIHPYILQELIIFPRNELDYEHNVPKEKELDNELYRIYRGINKLDSNIRSTEFRALFHDCYSVGESPIVGKTIKDIIMTRGNTPDTDTVQNIELVYKMVYLKDLYYSLWNWQTSRLIDKEIKKGEYSFDNFSKEIDYSLNFAPDGKPIDYKNKTIKNIMTKSKYDNLNNGVLFCDVLDVKKPELSNTYNVPDHIRKIITVDDHMRFELQVVSTTHGSHAIAYIKCNGQFYEYDGDTNTITTNHGIFEKVGTVDKLKDITFEQYMKGDQPYTEIVMLVRQPQLPMRVREGLQHIFTKK